MNLGRKEETLRQIERKSRCRLESSKVSYNDILTEILSDIMLIGPNVNPTNRMLIRPNVNWSEC